MSSPPGQKPPPDPPPVGPSPTKSRKVDKGEHLAFNPETVKDKQWFSWILLPDVLTKVDKYEAREEEAQEDFGISVVDRKPVDEEEFQRYELGKTLLVSFQVISSGREAPLATFLPGALCTASRTSRIQLATGRAAKLTTWN